MIYYAHSMLTYDTPRERLEIKLLEQHFEEKIFNPNQRKVQKAKEPMYACIELIRQPVITGIVFSSVQGWISAGVYFELRVAKKRGIPVSYLHGQEVEEFHGHFKMIGKNQQRQWAKVVCYASDNS